MCSRNIYKILSKSATALANHVSVVAVLKDFLHLGVLGSRREHSVASFKSECHHGCVHVVRAMSGAQCWDVGWSKFQIICLELVGKPPTNQSVSIWKYRNIEFLKKHLNVMLNTLEGLFCMLSNEITVLVMRWKQSWSEPWHQSHTSPLSFAWHTCRSSVRLPVAAFVFGSRVCVKTLSSYLSGLWFCWLHGQHEIAPTLPLWDSAADKMSSE